jgi:hypothetical protein
MLLEKRKISCHCWDSNPDRPACIIVTIPTAPSYPFKAYIQNTSQTTGLTLCIHVVTATHNPHESPRHKSTPLHTSASFLSLSFIKVNRHRNSVYKGRLHAGNSNGKLQSCTAYVKTNVRYADVSALIKQTRFSGRWLHCTSLRLYRHTSLIRRVRFQTTAVKRISP